jgi:hypothetical protein
MEEWPTKKFGNTASVLADPKGSATNKLRLFGSGSGTGSETQMGGDKTTFICPRTGAVCQISAPRRVRYSGVSVTSRSEISVLVQMVQCLGGCCGSLAELFRRRGSPPPWPVRCPVVSPRGDSELVVQSADVDCVWEDPETSWRRSEYDLRYSVNPRDSLKGPWKVLEKSWKILLVVLRDKFSSCENRHFGVSRSYYLFASRITVI